MASRPFTLLRRSSGGKPIYYFRLARPDGSRTTARSTGCTSRAAAERWVLDYLEKNGTAPSNGTRVRFDSWARDFWSPEGRYVRLRRAHGHSLSAAHVAHQHSIVQKYLLPMFAKKYLDEITADAVEVYLLDLYENGRPGAKGEARVSIAARTVNGIRGCFKKIMAEAVRLGHIRYNPVDATHKFKEVPRERGIFTRAELWRLLFAPDAWERVWQGERMFFLFVLVGAITGMRKGELRALMPQNIHADWIAINHGWDEMSGMTAAPKWGHRRIATIPESVSVALHRWISDNHIAPDGFVFPSGRRSRAGERIPIRESVIRQRFDAALRRIGIDEDERQRRNLVFHSLRHSLVTAMRAEAVDGWQARAVVGHRDERVFELYSDHAAPEHLSDVRDFQQRLLSGAPL